MVYDTPRDANLYLADTIVKYKGQAVHVSDVNEDMEALIYYQGGGRERVDVNSLDFSPIKLGYVYAQSNNKAQYLERRPQRQWRQGLSNSVCTIKDPKADEYLDLSINSSTIKRLVKGNFPTIFKAHRIALKKRTEVPFNREWSVDFSGTVRYKTKVVGELNNRHIKLMDTFHYLKDITEEYMNEYFKHL